MDIFFFIVLSTLSIIAYSVMDGFSLLRTIVILPLILFLPGHSLILLIFPDNETVEEDKRIMKKRNLIAFSFLLSIGFVSLVAFVFNEMYPLNKDLFGFNEAPTMVFIFMITIISYILVFIRRIVKKRYGRFDPDPIVSDLKTANKKGMLISVILVGILIISVSSLFYNATNDNDPPDVQLYILGYDREIENHPDLFVENDVRSIIVGVKNPSNEEILGHIHTSISPSIHSTKESIADPFVFNETTAFRKNIYILPGKTIEFQITFTIKESGKYTMFFDLYDGKDLIRDVWLNLKVFDPGMLYEDEYSDVRIFLTDPYDIPISSSEDLFGNETLDLRLHVHNHRFNILRVNVSLYHSEVHQWKHFEYNRTSIPSLNMQPGLAYYNNTILGVFTKVYGEASLMFSDGNHELIIIINEQSLGCVFRISIQMNTPDFR